MNPGTAHLQVFLDEMLRDLATELVMPDLAVPGAVRVVGGVATAHEFQPRPLYAPTAQQLGLIPSVQIPDLVRDLLPATQAPAAARNFLRRWLLRPPPLEVADHMQHLMAELLRLDVGYPSPALG